MPTPKQRHLPPAAHYVDSAHKLTDFASELSLHQAHAVANDVEGHTYIWTRHTDHTPHTDDSLFDFNAIFEIFGCHHGADCATHTRDDLPVSATLTYIPAQRSSTVQPLTCPCLRPNALLDAGLAARLEANLATITPPPWKLHPDDHHTALTEVIHRASNDANLVHDSLPRRHSPTPRMRGPRGAPHTLAAAMPANLGDAQARLRHLEVTIATHAHIPNDTLRPRRTPDQGRQAGGHQRRRRGRPHRH